MRDVVLSVRQLAAVREGGPEIVLKGARRGGGFGEVDALLRFNLDGFLWAVGSEGFEEVGDGVDSMGPGESFDERFF